MAIAIATAIATTIAATLMVIDDKRLSLSAFIGSLPRRHE
jgi:hypothetical protein